MPFLLLPESPTVDSLLLRRPFWTENAPLTLPATIERPSLTSLEFVLPGKRRSISLPLPPHCATFRHHWRPPATNTEVAGSECTSCGVAVLLSTKDGAGEQHG